MTTEQKIISDTNSKKQITTDDKIKIVQLTKSDTTSRQLDTSIQFLHRNPFLSVWEMDLGNLGTAANSLLYNPEVAVDAKLGIQAPKAYRWNADKISFYSTTRPYTNVYYRLGTKQEQAITLLHTQNITPRWNVAASYQKIGSPGFYKLQKTNHDNAFLNSHYVSVNQRYRLKAALVYSKIQQDENKGILNEDYLVDNNYNDRRLIPVNAQVGSGENKSGTTNYLRSAQIDLEHQYFLGRADSIFNSDSSDKIYTFKPIAGIKHHLYTDYSYFRFNDLHPDSVYNQFLPDTEDSLTVKYFMNRVGNSLSLTGTLRVREKIAEAEAGYGIEIDCINNGPYRHSYLNNYVFASLKKGSNQLGEWYYQAHFKFYVSGYTLGNTLLNTTLGKNLKSNTSLQAGLEIQVQSPTYIQRFYASNYFEYSTSLKKQSINRVFASVANPSRQAFAKLSYFTIANYIYYDTSSLQAQQYEKLLPLLQLQLSKEFHVSHFYLSNEVAVQTLPDNPALHLPTIAGIHSLSYRNYILKKKLQVATGLEMRYNTSFLVDNYNPYLFNFTSQNTRQIANAPQFNYFFNFKVKRYRATISFDQLQTFWSGNNINYSGYAAQNFCMRFGFHWVFIN
jgi:hypothetical protein